MQEYEVPLREDWAVLDGLNYVKDHLDGTLSFRWSCRMGICGSCGMTVNGDPALTCGTFLTDYAPGPCASSRWRTSPSSATSSWRSTTSCASCPTVKPWLVRDDDGGVEDVEFLQTPGRAGRVQAVQHVHQLHALLLGLPGVRARAGLPRPGRDRAGPALQPRLPRPGRPPAAGRARHRRGGVGLHLRRRVHDRVPEGRRPGGRHPALQAHRRDPDAAVPWGTR